MTRIATRLLAIIALHVLLALGNGAFLVHQERVMQNDAAIINHAGVLRGSMQRAAKLALAGRDPSDAVALADTQFERFREEAGPLAVRKGRGRFERMLDGMAGQWERLKQGMDAYAQSGSDASRQAVVARSEDLWTRADDAVAWLADAAESKVIGLRWALAVIVVDVIALAVVVWLIVSIVRGRLERDANYDPLTGALNRAVFQNLAGRMLAEARRYGHPLSMLMMDIDHFKDVNDTHGHKAGDAVLRELAALLRGRVRASDAVCRVGGEEFAVLCPHTSRGEAAGLAGQLRRAAEGHDFSVPGPVTVSIGVAQATDEDDPDSLFRRADARLYRAKESGRNRVVARDEGEDDGPDGDRA